MEQNQPNVPMNNTSPSMPGNSNTNGDKKNVGPIVATLVIVLILIIAALYVFASHLNQQAIPDDSTVNADDTTGTSSQSVAPVTHTSTDVQSLQQDLNSATQGVDQQSI